MAYTATHSVVDTAAKKVLHIHVFKDGVDWATFVFTFTTRANLRSQIQTLAGELGAEFTRIRQEI